MSGGVQVEHEGRTTQDVVARAALRDSRLSWGARGLFAFLWNLPIGWFVRANHLASLGPQGRDAVRKIMRELETVEALRVEILRDDSTGRVQGKKWVIRNPDLWAKESSLTPQKIQEKSTINTESLEIPLSAGPTSGKDASKDSPNPGSSSSLAKIFHNGMQMWKLDDFSLADQIAEEASAEELEAAIQAVEATGKEPYPRRVWRQIETARDRQTKRKKANVQQGERMPSSPAVVRAGLAAAKAAIKTKNQTKPKPQETPHEKNHQPHAGA